MTDTAVAFEYKPLSRSVAQLRPSSPAPSWPEPDPDVVGDPIRPPTFPLPLMGRWSDWIETAAKAKSCPPDFVATALCVVAASLIGARRAQPWAGWQEPPILWAALVGPPSSGKSPAADCILNAVRELENERAEQFGVALLDHETKVEAAKQRAERWKEDVAEAVKQGLAPPVKPAAASEPEPPVRPRFITNDTTIEKMGELLAGNRRGLLLHRDELSSFLLNFERRGGSDRGFWIEAYGGRPATIDRVKRAEPLIVPALAASILGGLQPDRLASDILGTADDGLAARFLYTWPAPVAFERPAHADDSTHIKAALSRLASLAMGVDAKGATIPVVVPFSEAAAAILEDWRKQQSEREAEAHGLLLSWLGKAPGVVVRLALVLQFLDWAASAGEPEPTEIDEQHLTAALDLVEAYYLPMAARVFGSSALKEDARDAAILAKWLLRHQRDKINLRALRRLAGFPLHDDERLKRAAAFLSERDWLRPGPKPDGRGRPPLDYLINPRAFDGASQ